MAFMMARHCSGIRKAATIMKRLWRFNLAPFLAMSLCVLGHAAAQEAQKADVRLRCTRGEIGVAQAVAASDGRTLMLADGREVRLAGIETSSSGGALNALAAGKTLRLARLGPEQDRYGRLVAFAFLPDTPQSVQQTLLAEGEARVSARIGDKACADALLAVEREARAAKRGLWADPNFAPLAAENLDGLAAARGHFALVEGKVLSVRESGSTIYVNFGRRWTRDFAVTIPKRQKRTFAAAGIDLDRLQGRRIRVRGFVEERGGPIIDTAAPEQFETID
jgi:endonuclease YncB( thermonuclease family)